AKYIVCPDNWYFFAIDISLPAFLVKHFRKNSERVCRRGVFVLQGIWMVGHQFDFCVFRFPHTRDIQLVFKLLVYKSLFLRIKATNRLHLLGVAIDEGNTVYKPGVSGSGTPTLNLFGAVFGVLCNEVPYVEHIQHIFVHSAIKLML